MSSNPIQLIVAGFATEDAAQAQFKAIKEFRKETGAIRIVDAAWLRKDAHGKLKIREVHDMGGGRGTAMGGLLGGTIGLLTGGAGLVIAAGSGVIGGLLAKFRDSGFDDARLKLAGDQLPNESSMLIVLVEHTWVGDVEKMLAEAGADLTMLAISEAIASELREGNDAFVTVAADDSMIEIDAGSTADEAAQPDGAPEMESAPDAEAVPASASKI